MSGQPHNYNDIGSSLDEREREREREREEEEEEDGTLLHNDKELAKIAFFCPMASLSCTLDSHGMAKKKKTIYIRCCFIISVITGERY